MAIRVTEQDQDSWGRLVIELDQDGILYYVRWNGDGTYSTLDSRGQWFVGSSSPCLIECAKQYVTAHPELKGP